MSSSSTASSTTPKKSKSGKLLFKSKSKDLPVPKPFSEDEIKDLRAAFILLDKNNDGRIQPCELQDMLLTFGIHVPEAHIIKIIERASTGGTAGLTESEFFAWILPLLEVEDSDTNPDRDLLAAFQVFDKDKNGFISRDELKLAMEMMGEVVDETDLDQLISLADLDRDGRIDYEEFTRMMLA